MSDSTPARTVVLKLGGSLLDLPMLSERLTDLLDQLGSVAIVLIVGGGRTADEVRRWDAVHRLGDHPAHWLAIDAMDFNAGLVRTLLQRAGRETTTELSTRGHGGVVIPSVRKLLAKPEMCDLPESWDVTSDAIAVRIAQAINADCVYLLKSVDPPVDRKIASAVEQGLLDPVTLELGNGLTILWANLRANPIAIAELIHRETPR